MDFHPQNKLQFFLQLFISVGHYYDFKELARPKSFSFNYYGNNGSSISSINSLDKYFVEPSGASPHTFLIGNPDFNFKSIRLNAVFRWEFLPGSTAYLVWTRDSEHGGNPSSFDFGRDIGNLLTASYHEDVLLVKVA